MPRDWFNMAGDTPASPPGWQIARWERRPEWLVFEHTDGTTIGVKEARKGDSAELPDSYFLTHNGGRIDCSNAPRAKKLAWARRRMCEHTSTE